VVLFRAAFGLTGHGSIRQARHTKTKEKDQGLSTLVPVTGLSGCKPQRTLFSDRCGLEASEDEPLGGDSIVRGRSGSHQAARAEFSVV